MVSLFQNDMVLGFYFEIIVMSISAVILGLILRKYKQKNHRLTMLLFLIFINYFLSILFSWLMKYLQLYHPDYYLSPPTIADYFFISRLTYFRISFIFVTIAIWISYGFKIEVFQDKYNMTHTWFVRGITLGIILYNLFILEETNTMLDVYAFLMVFLYMVIIYGSFMRKSILVRQKVQDATFKSAFLSLTWMAVFFIAVLFFFLLDRVMILIDAMNGYTIFYFLGWSCVIFAMITTYFGYLAPRKPNPQPNSQ